MQSARCCIVILLRHGLALLSRGGCEIVTLLCHPSARREGGSTARGAASLRSGPLDPDLVELKCEREGTVRGERRWRR